jgi:hypothetical protein
VILSTPGITEKTGLKRIYPQITPKGDVQRVEKGKYCIFNQICRRPHNFSPDTLASLTTTPDKQNILKIKQ